MGCGGVNQAGWLADSADGGARSATPPPLLSPFCSRLQALPGLTGSTSPCRTTMMAPGVGGQWVRKTAADTCPGDPLAVKLAKVAASAQLQHQVRGGDFHMNRTKNLPTLGSSPSSSVAVATNTVYFHCTYCTHKKKTRDQAGDSTYAGWRRTLSWDCEGIHTRPGSTRTEGGLAPPKGSKMPHPPTLPRQWPEMRPHDAARWGRCDRRPGLGESPVPQAQAQH